MELPYLTFADRLPHATSEDIETATDRASTDQGRQDPWRHREDNRALEGGDRSPPNDPPGQHCRVWILSRKPWQCCEVGVHGAVHPVGTGPARYAATLIHCLARTARIIGLPGFSRHDGLQRLLQARQITTTTTDGGQEVLNIEPQHPHFRRYLRGISD